jgi:hypothetical protein
MTLEVTLYSPSHKKYVSSRGKPNIDTGGDFRFPVNGADTSTVPRVKSEAELFNILSCHFDRKRSSGFRTRRASGAGLILEDAARALPRQPRMFPVLRRLWMRAWLGRYVRLVGISGTADTGEFDC